VVGVGGGGGGGVEGGGGVGGVVGGGGGGNAVLLRFGRPLEWVYFLNDVFFGSYAL